MEFIHISESFNKPSILSRGLQPTPVSLPNHLIQFEKDGQCTKDGKALYTWESSEKNEKYIKDMVFCKVFIHPRNEMAYDTDFFKICNEFLGPYRHMTYDIYEISEEDKEHLYIHVQEPTLDKHNSTCGMPCEFSHNDKILHIFKEPQTNIKIIGQVEFELGKRNEYVVRVR